MDRELINKMLGMTEGQIDEIASSFEKGVWNREEYGEPSVGRPSAFGEVMKPVTFKEPVSVIAAIDERAKKLGSSRSEYLRFLVAQDLAQSS